jgi:hypothetical protein
LNGELSESNENMSCCSGRIGLGVEYWCATEQSLLRFQYLVVSDLFFKGKLKVTGQEGNN